MRYKSYYNSGRPCVYVYDVDWFDPAVIMNSGQCFRALELHAEDKFWFIFKDKATVVTKVDDTSFIFDCSPEDFLYIWYDYFDFGTDYSRFNEIIYQSNNDYLIEALNASYGMRILRQELFETLISFTISQQMQIPRIREIIHNICWRYGSKNSVTVHPNFPDENVFSLFDEFDYELFGLGYRGPYLKDIGETVCSGELNLSELSKCNYNDAMQELLKLHGVGPKIASCTCLYGLHHMDAFPIDTWMKQILDNHFDSNAEYFTGDDSPFKSFAGYVQQIMFYYERSVINGRK